MEKKVFVPSCTIRKQNGVHLKETHFKFNYSISFHVIHKNEFVYELYYHLLLSCMCTFRLQLSAWYYNFMALKLKK